MKYVSFFILGTIIASGSYAQIDNKIIIGKVDSVYSSTLKEERKVWVYVPGINNSFRDTSKRYPVVYLLDGDGHFESVVGMIQQLSQVNGNTIVPEMIVVGIPNTDRTRDLTPTHIASDIPMMDSNFSKNTGGGENFAAFLEKELMPHIDSGYPTQPFKMLIGHSFGGLAVMNIITNHTKLFNAYIAIDPSMWYDKEQFLKNTEKKLSAQKYNGISLYLGIANTMPAGMTVEKMKKDTTIDTRHIRSIFAMDKFIKANPQNGLRYASKYYAEDDHSSVPLTSEYDGLRFIFKWYRFNFTSADFTDSATDVALKLQRHYQTISKEFGYKVSPPEMQINGLGYNALSLKQYAKASALFQMNITNYPQSGNAYDSYADLLAAKKDTANAIANYEKAFALSNSPDTKQKMEQLQGKSIYAPTTADLEKYIGEFEFEGISLTAKSYLKENTLWVSASGEGDFELVPSSPNIFTIKGMKGYKIEFQMDGNKLLGVTSTQPNGTYKAHVKK